MHPVYHAKITVSTKNFPRSEGRKCGVKGLVRRGLMVWSRSIACSGAFDEIALRLIPSLACLTKSKYCETTMHPVYHAKITVSTKNFPRSEGRKCGVKGLLRRGLMVWSRSIACSGAFDEIARMNGPWLQL